MWGFTPINEQQNKSYRVQLNSLKEIRHRNFDLISVLSTTFLKVEIVIGKQKKRQTLVSCSVGRYGEFLFVKLSLSLKLN